MWAKALFASNGAPYHWVTPTGSLCFRFPVDTNRAKTRPGKVCRSCVAFLAPAVRP